MSPGFRLSPCSLLLLCAVVLGAIVRPGFAVSPADATSPAAGATAPALDPADTQRLIDTLRDPARRAALIATLENLERAAPSAPGAATPTASAPAKTVETSAVVGLQPNSLGAQLMTNGTRLADTISTSLLLTVRGVANFPDLLRWSHGIARDPAALVSGLLSAGRVLAVLLLAFGGELLIWRLTRRFYASLAMDARRQDAEVQVEQAAREPADPVEAPPRPSRLLDGWLLLLRLPTILMALSVDLLPPLAFLAVATVASGTPLAQSEYVRAAILAVVDACGIL